MANSSADRNLLFGILALQMDFIDREQLVEAMHAWVLVKSNPLSQILLEQGMLDKDTHALLEALVGKHLDLHGDDPQKSLAALSTVGSLGDELREIDDQELEASLGHVSRAPRAEFQAANTLPVGQTSGGLRFRILRPHAKGGLGEVFVAEDTELNREVALKEIQDRFADSLESRARFVQEAEITGGLEHPGIVPVYGLGQYDDGRPFYAMRFIRGDSLTEAIERFHKRDDPSGQAERWHDPSQRSLELHKMLRLFVDVCNAIQYAHSRGVLHRDLKPGNIMLGKYGEALIVDWGLAKAVGSVEGKTIVGETTLQPSSGSGSAPTRMGSALGTPQYMPPEQASGDLDQLGPASDTYSLGATLYCLLAGQPPFTGADTATILRLVRKGHFQGPRAVKPQVDAALEAICLKAMSLSPKDRYQTPNALAEDIEHWLADEPVSAYRESVSERVVRWIRRHRQAATFAAGVAIVIVVAIIASLLIRDAKQRTENAVRFGEQQKLLAEERDRNLHQQQRIAEREKIRADAAVYEKNGAINASWGNLEYAIADYKRALQLKEQLVQSETASDQYLLDLAATYEVIGAWEVVQGRLDEGLTNYQRASDLRQQMAQKNPLNIPIQRHLAEIVRRQAFVKELYEKEADVGYDRSTGIRRQLADATVDASETWQDRTTRRDCIAQANIVIASHQETLEMCVDRWSKAKTHYEVALADLNSLAESKGSADFAQSVREVLAQMIVECHNVIQILGGDIATESVNPQVQGIWESNWGSVALAQTGNQVSGRTDYPNGNKGKIFGVLHGRVLVYEWFNLADSGTGIMVFSENGDSAEGHWRDTRTAATGQWTWPGRTDRP